MRTRRRGRWLLKQPRLGARMCQGTFFFIHGGSMKSDTIAAIATALSDAGIGIIRISGPEAIAVANRVVVNKKKEHTLKKPGRRIRFIMVLSKKTERFWMRLWFTVMKAPRSYTTEDTVEINCHGGVLLTKRVLGRHVLHAGARMAEPGEFTKRAFLSGRIDLSEAEAVMDLIQAKNPVFRCRRRSNSCAARSQRK